jgi:peptide/nickel transport system ATP-binding protein
VPALLEVRQLNIEFHSQHAALAMGRQPGAAVPTRTLSAVRDLSFSIAPGEVLGLVGESGSGKSITSLAIMRLLPPQALVSGQILFADSGSPPRNLAALADDDMRQLRGSRIAMIFQEPMTALNPVMRVGEQIAEAVAAHNSISKRISKKEAWQRAVDAMNDVAIPDAARRARDYPHQLSGGMRQRIMIAMAIVNRPQLLIADEPTTALDVTIQAQILDLLAREQRRRHMAMIMITHDLGVVAGRTDEVAVMYAGRVVERAPTHVLFKNMQMPYTAALLAAIPKLEAAPHTPLAAIPGRPPDPTRPLKGCSFAPRCRYAGDLCLRAKPALAAAETEGHQYACFHPLNIGAGVSA